MNARGPKIREGVELVEVDSEAVLLDPSTKQTHQLNATGTILWYALDGTKTVDELAADFGRAFGVDESQVRADVEAFVDELSRTGLLEQPCEQ